MTARGSIPRGSARIPQNSSRPGSTSAPETAWSCVMAGVAAAADVLGVGPKSLPYMSTPYQRSVTRPPHGCAASVTNTGWEDGPMSTPHRDDRPSDGPGADVSVRVGWAEDAPSIAAVQVRAWRAEYAGLLPPAVLAGLDPEDFALAWTASLERPRDARNRVL